MSKSMEKMIAALALAKAVNVMEPFIVPIASAMRAQAEAQAAAKAESEGAKAVKGKAYNLVRDAIIAAGESDVEPEALRMAFAAGLAQSGVPENTIRPYAGTLKLAATAMREGRVTSEQVRQLDMTGLRDACRSDAEKEIIAIRKAISDNLRKIKAKETLLALAAEIEALTPKDEPTESEE